MNSLAKKDFNKGILSSIGNTPLVPLKDLFPESDISLYAKIEAFNPGGSIKDRTAYNILWEAISQGKLKEGDTVIESSSGNMGVGLAQVCLKFGLNFIVVVDPLINSHTLEILKTYGARIEMVDIPSDEGGYLNARLERVQSLMKENEHSFWPNQYANRANPMAHRETMQEIIHNLSGKIDYLFAATSTCGTIMGCSKYLREIGLDTKVVAVDAAGSVIFGQSASKRLIPGHGAGRPSELLDARFIDRVVHVNDKESIAGCHRLLKKEAILAGGSSGAVVSAVHKLLPDLPKASNCVMILGDRGERYLNTIYSEDWVREHFGDAEMNEEPEPQKAVCR